MKVKAVVSFASMAGGEMVPWPVGKVAELPAGVNWLDLGWVVPVEGQTDALQSPVAEIPADEPAKKKPGRPRKAAE